MKRCFVIFCFLLLGNFSFAQNLVLNPGFEEHGEIYGNGAGSDNMRGNHVKNWFSPTAGSPDYFVRANPYLVNQYGPPQSYSGLAMAGIAVYGGRKEYREYVIGEFSAPLEEGVTYNFSMALALAAYSGQIITSFGVCLTHDRILSTDMATALKFIPQLVIDSTDQESMNGKWMVFNATYIARGGEKFITIGNFAADKKTKSKKVNGDNGAPYAYYYLDDISLSPEKDDTLVAEMIVPEIPVDTIFKIAAGKTLVIDNVYFETDRSIIKKESFPILDEIIAALAESPELNVEIAGHTDADGTVSHNQTLSEARAEAVARYFIENGITKGRITSKGYGSSRPISADKNKNRRVEFIFSD